MQTRRPWPLFVSSNNLPPSCFVSIAKNRLLPCKRSLTRCSARQADRVVGPRKPPERRRNPQPALAADCHRAGGVVIVMASVFVFLLYRRVRKTNRKLRVVNQQLEFHSIRDPLTGLLQPPCLFVFYDVSTGRPWAGAVKTTAPMVCCCSTSTISRTSMTPWATLPVTACSLSGQAPALCRARERHGDALGR